MKTKQAKVNKTTETRQFIVQAEQCQNLASQILGLLNQTDSRTDLIKDILFLVKVTTGFEAVGLRLRDREL